MRSSRAILGCFGLSFLVAQSAAGQVGLQKDEAHVRFQAGLSWAQAGKLDRALADFKAAYQAQPHFSVLYNIAQAESALGHPQAALVAFEQYLAEGGDQVGEVRRAEVTRLIELNRSRLGRLEIRVADPGQASVWLDGAALDATQLNKPIAVEAGAHSILQAPRGASAPTRRVEVAANQTLVVHLEPVALTDATPGQLAIDCHVPGIKVVVSDGTTARTPLAYPLLVGPGALEVRFSRPGYNETTSQVMVTPRGNHKASCAQLPRSPLPAQLAARLEVRPRPATATVRVDGQSFSGQVLPYGVHELSVERTGYAPWRRSISLEPQRTLRLDVVLSPLHETAVANAAAASIRRSWGYTIAAAGAGLVLGGVGLSVWNRTRYDEWLATPARHTREATSIQRVDDLALAMLFSGGASLVGGGWLLFAPPVKK